MLDVVAKRRRACADVTLVLLLCPPQQQLNRHSSDGVVLACTALVATEAGEERERVETRPQRDNTRDTTAR